MLCRVLAYDFSRTPSVPRVVDHPYLRLWCELAPDVGRELAGRPYINDSLCRNLSSESNALFLLSLFMFICLLGEILLSWRLSSSPGPGILSSLINVQTPIHSVLNRLFHFKGATAVTPNNTRMNDQKHSPTFPSDTFLIELLEKPLPESISHYSSDSGRTHAVHLYKSNHTRTLLYT